MPIRDKILVRKVLQKLDFDQNLFKPLVVISDRNSFTSVMPKRHAIQHVLH